MQKRSPLSFRPLTRALRAGGAVAMAATVACAPGEIVGPAEAEVVAVGPSFESFAASLPRGRDGSFLVYDDVAVQSESVLRAFYEAQVRPGRLVAVTDGRAIRRWTDDQKRALTYCVDRSTFRLRHAEFVETMRQAASAWAQEADVQFIHVAGEDDRCDEDNQNVLFHVYMGGPDRETATAQAFLPGEPRAGRRVVVREGTLRDATARLRTMTHELGHTLGFAHEHSDAVVGTCDNDNSANLQRLTPVDADSIMAQVRCGGASSRPTARDAHGAQRVYGSRHLIAGVVGEAFVNGTTKKLFRSFHDINGIQWKAVAGSPTLIGGAGAVLEGAANEKDVFVRTGAGRIWHGSGNNDQWRWEDLQGDFVTEPVAVSPGPGRIDLFGLGADHHLWHAFWSTGQPWRWERIEGGLFAGPPAVATSGPGRYDVVARGWDQALWHVSWEGAGWQIRSLGGQVRGYPALVSRGPGLLDAFAVGTNDTLWHAALGSDGSWRWSEVSSHPVEGSPTAARGGIGAGGTLYAYARTPAGTLRRYRLPSGGSWDVRDLGGDVTASPVAAAADYVYTRTASGRLQLLQTSLGFIDLGGLFH